MPGKVSSFLVCILLSTQVTAWWDLGHMMTAQVAKLHLQSSNPDVLSWAESIIADFNNLTDGCSNTFVEAAVWADDIKETGTDYLDDWHTTKFPINKDGLMIVLDPVQIQSNSMDALRRARLVLTNKKTIHQEHSWAKAQMIRYVLHVVGDMHQPLHNSNFYNATFKKGDQGGNLNTVIKLDGTKVNLHAYWDAGAFVLQPDTYPIIRPLNQSYIQEMESWASNNMVKHPLAAFNQASMSDYVKWTQEGYQESMDIVYPFFAQTNQVTEEYQTLAYDLVERNIVLGGYRLALFLTEIYQSIQTSKQEISFVESKLNSIIMNDHMKASIFGDVTIQL